MRPSRRSQFATLSLVMFPILGGLLGAGLVLIWPPQNPVDFLPSVVIISMGFLMIGLLVGFLFSLWLRGRVTAEVACAAIAIPICALCWFLFGKGGNWNVAVWFGIGGIVAGILFIGRSADLLANREDDAS